MMLFPALLLSVNLHKLFVQRRNRIILLDRPICSIRLTIRTPQAAEKQHLHINKCTVEKIQFENPPHVYSVCMCHHVTLRLVSPSQKSNDDQFMFDLQVNCCHHIEFTVNQFTHYSDVASVSQSKHFTSCQIYGNIWECFYLYRY